MMDNHMDEYLGRLRATIEALPRERMNALGETLFRAYRNNKQVFLLGNGGSSSTASHMAADLAKNTIGPNMKRFRIVSLNDNAAIMTALANDLGYENVFSEQLTNLVQAGDVLIVVSASGNSPNVLKAMRYARSRSAEVVGLLGFDGGTAAELADIALIVPSDHYGVVEDVHLIINHILVDYFQDPPRRGPAVRRIAVSPMNAMILAAGRGTRLGQLGQTVPKVLVDVGGEPLLARQIPYLKDSGIERIVINAHHLADQIQSFAAAHAQASDITSRRARAAWNGRRRTQRAAPSWRGGVCGAVRRCDRRRAGRHRRGNPPARGRGWPR